jgi:uncharacterized membrane protein
MRDLQEKPVISGSETPRKTQVLAMDEKLAGWLSYAPFVGLICSIIWVATEPRDSKFVRFNAIQSLALGVVSFVAWTALGILGAIGLAAITSVVSSLLSLVVFAAWVVCMFNAGKGRMFKLPLIGDIAESMA